MWRPCFAFFPGFSDKFLRISRQPSAEKVALAQQDAPRLASLDVRVFNVNHNKWERVADSCYVNPSHGLRDSRTRGTP